jgi:hypothetical protein
MASRAQLLPFIQKDSFARIQVHKLELALHRLRSTSTTLGLGLISAGALAFEIGLTRLFAVQQFHHFAFMVISLAVMGIAASGVLLALRPKSDDRPAAFRLLQHSLGSTANCDSPFVLLRRRLAFFAGRMGDRCVSYSCRT